MLTAGEAARIWRYDPETGHFFWLIKPKYDVEIGSRSGSFDSRYWRLRWRGKTYKASRVAWLMMMGEWPKDQVDHINGVKTDDRFENLRDASPQENARNKGVRKNNKLGIKGVYFSEKIGKYVAQLNLSGSKKSSHLGLFSTKEEAKACYDSAVQKHHGKFAVL